MGIKNIPKGRVEGAIEVRSSPKLPPQLKTEQKKERLTTSKRWWFGTYREEEE